jgi:hypothetical protein
MNALLRFPTFVFTAIVAAGLGSVSVAQEPQHFDRKGKMPSRYTIEAQQLQRAILPLADKPSAASSLRHPTARS